MNESIRQAKQVGSLIITTHAAFVGFDDLYDFIKEASDEDVTVTFAPMGRDNVEFQEKERDTLEHEIFDVLNDYRQHRLTAKTGVKKMDDLINKEFAERLTKAKKEK